jgi:N-acyl-L-homoserine lactone synthetase
MFVISGAPRTLPQGLYSKVAHYRHKVFIEQLGWQLKAVGEAEQDQFDRSDTVYVVAQDEDGHISGCARLLPTTRPYLLSEVFPQLLNGLPPPCSPDIWELSRFASVDFNCKATQASGQFSSSIAIKLLRESIACAAEHGAKRLITVSPIGIERLLRRAGIHAHRAGPPMVIDGHSIIACWIEVASNIVLP